MAKRIKVSGKPPRGLSKSTRMHKEGYRVKKSSGEYDPTGLDKLGIDPKDFDQETKDRISKFVNRAKKGSTAPSSTRKKLVKEGNRKFIGPRQEPEFDPFEEFESSSASYPRDSHEFYRGYKKSHRRQDDKDWADWVAKNKGKPVKLSAMEQKLLKRNIASTATSREGKLLHKLLSFLQARENANYGPDAEVPF
jgi:hypothetical protein